jgi:hypothetical protein
MSVMEISSEDSLRLNVLLANAKAIRIDENSLSVYGLSEHGEAKIKLNPNCRADRYLRFVRELLSSAVLGSPGGYPIYLKRWTRMGQLSHDHLDDLLLLGEPEAVVAVACSPNLTDELARRAWWAMSDAENARRMLERDCVVQGAMGRVLAEFLVEFLPFEADPMTIMRTVCLLLQPGLIAAEERLRIWRKGLQKNVFLIGFLLATPDDLPEALSAHRDWERAEHELAALAGAANPYARQVLRCLSGPGQAFLRACQTVLRKPSNQDVVVALLDAVALYFAPVRPHSEPVESIDAQHAQLGAWIAGPSCPAALQASLAAVPWLQPFICAMLTLACCDRRVVQAVFAGTDSIGSLMRKKLEPVSRPVLELLACLVDE